MSHKRQAWIVLIVAFLAGVTATLNQFKVPPVMPALAAELHLDPAAGGWLMSVFSAAAIVLSIPAALALRRVGFKAMGLIALGCAATGSALGAVAPTSAVLLASRVIEGISFALMAVVAPALITRWFGPDELGLPMGIWATWVPLGSLISFTLGPLVERALGWRALWWIGAGLAVAMLVLYGLFARPPKASPGLAGARPAAPPQSELLKSLFGPGNWLLGVAFGSFAGALVAYTVWAPGYLSSELSVPGPAASVYTSLVFLAGIVANLVAGWIIGHMRHGHALLAGALAVTAVLYAWGFRLPGVGIVAPYMLALGFVSNLVPTAAFTLAPRTVRRAELAGLAMAVLSVVSNLGIFIGPPLVGAIVGRGQWGPAGWLLAATSAFGAVAALVAWRLAGRHPGVDDR